MPWKAKAPNIIHPFHKKQQKRKKIKSGKINFVMYNFIFGYATEIIDKYKMYLSEFVYYSIMIMRLMSNVCKLVIQLYLVFSTFISHLYFGIYTFKPLRGY